jgi:hypothetical protein
LREVDVESADGIHLGTADVVLVDQKKVDKVFQKKDGPRALSPPLRGRASSRFVLLDLSER